MPIYEFECGRCGYQFEKLQKLSDPPPTQCPKCGHRKVSQLLSAPAIQFKGTGWYVTDYARKSSTESSGNGSKSKRDSGKTLPSESSPSSSTESKSSIDSKTSKES